MGEEAWQEGALPLWGLRPHSPRDIWGKGMGIGLHEKLKSRQHKSPPLCRNHAGKVLKLTSTYACHAAHSFEIKPSLRFEANERETNPQTHRKRISVMRERKDTQDQLDIVDASKVHTIQDFIRVYICMLQKIRGATCILPPHLPVLRQNAFLDTGFETFQNRIGGLSVQIPENATCRPNQTMNWAGVHFVEQQEDCSIKM